MPKGWKYDLKCIGVADCLDPFNVRALPPMLFVPHCAHHFKRWSRLKVRIGRENGDKCLMTDH